jgi:hypothetical protein
MLKRIVLSICLLTTLSAAIAQSSQEPEIKVVNDPLLWKNMLKLKSYQKSRIMEINEAFYNAIISKNKERAVKTKSDLTKLMQQRSDGIWNTFSTRQKNIWKKLAASYGDNDQSVSL